MTVIERALATWLGPLLGSTVPDIAELTQPWGSRTRTHLVTLDRGERVVVQQSQDRVGMARRLRVAQELAVLAPWLPVPEVLAGDARATPSFMVTSYIAGRGGGALLADDGGATGLGSAMGALADDVARAPVARRRLSATWADAGRLDAAARRWLARSSDALTPALTTRAEQLLPLLPAAFSGARPVLAHGDFAPVNVIMRDGELVALLDLERARIAHPLFDAAWLRMIVRHHHPDRWDAFGPAFMAADGIEQSREVARNADLLAALQCLEMVDGTPRSQVAVRSAWVHRLSEVIDRIAAAVNSWT